MRITIVGLLILAIISCTQNRNPINAKVTKVVADSIAAFVVAMDSVKKSILLPGELLPFEKVQIRARVQGYIGKLNVDIGSKVGKDQLLALIDAPELSLTTKELDEKVKAAKSRFQSSKDYFERIYAASKSEGVIAAIDLQRAQNQMLADSSDYKASLFAASSYLHSGTYLAITAPFSGIITERNIELGSLVGNTSEKPLFELEDISHLRLRVPVPEIYTGASLLNNSCELTSRAFPDKKFKARLIHKAGSINPENRSEIWEFEVPNGTGELKAGGYADVKLQFYRSGQSILIPVSSLVTTLERKFVIKVSRNRTQWVDVRPGFNMGEKQEIFGELKAGDTLVLKANEELKDGIKLAIKL